MSDLVNKVAELLNAPVDLVQRSAEARAAASGISVDDVLSSWAGGESVAASAATAPEKEAPVEEVVEEAPVKEVIKETVEDTTTEVVEVAEPQEVVEEVVEEIVELKNESALSFISGVLLVGLFTFLFAFVIPKNQATEIVNDSLNNSVSASNEVIKGAEVYAELNCQSCHTQMLSLIGIELAIDYCLLVHVLRWWKDLVQVLYFQHY